MKIQFNDGPERIRTDEGDIERGVPFEATEALGEKLLRHPGYTFTKIEPAEGAKPEKPKGGRKW